MKPDLVRKQSLLCLTRDDPDISHLGQIERLLYAGASFIQLRSKSLPYNHLLQETESAVKLTKSKGCKLIINDDYKLAKKVDADGVHLGISDAPIEVVRDYLPEQKIIGKTVHSLEEAQIALEEKPDYIGLGPFRKSTTKTELIPTLSEHDLKEILKLLQPIPVFLIGGLTSNDFHLIDHFGIQGICLCSALHREDKGSSSLPEIIQKSKCFEPSTHSF